MPKENFTLNGLEDALDGRDNRARGLNVRLKHEVEPAPDGTVVAETIECGPEPEADS